MQAKLSTVGKIIFDCIVTTLCHILGKVTNYARSSYSRAVLKYNIAFSPISFEFSKTSLVF